MADRDVEILTRSKGLSACQFCGEFFLEPCTLEIHTGTCTHRCKDYITDDVPLSAARKANKRTEKEKEPDKKLEVQTTEGNHLEYSMANNLNGCQHSAVKYITRFEGKLDDPKDPNARGGQLDLDKARHCIDLLEHFAYENK